MPAATEAPPAPAPGEINLSNLPSKGPPATMPDAIMKAALAAAGEPVEEAPKPDPKPEPPKPTAKPEPPKPAPAARVETPKPEPSKEPPKGGPKELREAYERAQAKVAELENTLGATAKEKAEAYTKLAEFDGKMKSYEKRITEEFEPRIKALSEKEQRLQQVEEQLRVTNYMATPDFHDRYNKPIAEIEAEVKDILASNPAIRDGVEVAATIEDFNYVLGAKTLNEAGQRAEERFGKFAGPQITQLRARLISATRSREEAGKRAALEATEYEKSQQARAAEFQAKLRQAINDQEIKLVSEFVPQDADDDIKLALSEGRKMADEATAIDPRSMSPEQIASTVAKARASIQRAHVRDRQISKLQEENKRLNDELAAYRKTDPDVEPRNQGNRPEPEDARDPGDNLGGDAKSKLMAAAMRLASQ